MVAQKPSGLLGEQLIRKNIIGRDQLRIALTEQQKSGEQLGRILVALGFVSESVLRDALGEALGRESIDLRSVVPDVEALKMVPKELARRYTLVPISFDQGASRLTLAMADVYNLVALDRLRAQFAGQVEIKALLAGEIEVEDAIDQFYGFELSVDGILNEIETGEIDYSTIQNQGTASEGYSQPFVRLVDSILADAVKREASDVHFEPEDGFLRIRYRIDGVLRPIRSLHKNYWSAIVVRLKVMAQMNIAETRAPQDGRMSLAISGHSIDFRVSTMPTTYGENIVLRILDRDKGIMKLEDLGISELPRNELQLMMARPEGLILLTGPTGSGKTTTLYSMLNYINTESVNIMTMEDPVEYPMSMVRQTSVNETIKLNFATGIRAMMRQDPDVILVGEIRDQDTAEMAFRAAMTGHQVYSTLHTNSAVGALPRLLDLGVSPDVMTGNIIGIVAQRLVRRLCLYCRQRYTPDGIEARILGDYQGEGIYQAVGCTRCGHTGYRGRIALIESIRMSSALDDLIFKHASSREILHVALEQGFRSIAEDGLMRIQEGITTLEEVSRVVDLTSRI